jgi:AhpD family alkylhydroperoxidase
MEPRLNLYADPAVARSLKQFAAASKTLLDAPLLPESLTNLVMLRASQINGCGWCTDIHSKDAVHAGEDPVRLALVAAWRESTVFSDAERAALELTEEGTRIADDAGGVSEAAWAAAAVHYSEQQLAALVALIALINAANRMGVVNRMAGGSYQVGQLG